MHNIRIGLRAKVLLVSIVLLTIPLVGYFYVKEIEKFLRETQVATLKRIARAVAVSLSDPDFFQESRPNISEVIDPRSEEIISVLPGASSAISTSDNTSEQIEQTLKNLALENIRVWVIDRKRRILVVAGSLKKATQDSNQYEQVSKKLSLGEQIEQSILHPIYSKILKTNDTSIEEAPPSIDASSPYSFIIETAFNGIPNNIYSATSNPSTALLSFAQPIWNGDRVVGAVVVEETTNAIQSINNRAMEKLLTATLIVFLLGALPLFIFASRLSTRVKRLRDQAEQAIDAHGRVLGSIVESKAKDEVGDLSRSFSNILERLGQHNDYLEKMASRLSHELRTPIAVVRSSLDNLKLTPLPEDTKIYMERAEEGLNRLNLILTRMSEATRLEQSLQNVDRENFDLRTVITGCVEGYKLAYPQHRFNLEQPDHAVLLNGVPDLIAQMLDKLISNAMDFSQQGSPIIIRLQREENACLLRIINAGPSLPKEMQEGLFKSMVSMRPPGNSAHPHLGLGLFIARLIVEFHHGTIVASNREDTEGVVITIKLPITASF